jgi:hypothetical protein
MTFFLQSCTGTVYLVQRIIQCYAHRSRTGEIKLVSGLNALIPEDQLCNSATSYMRCETFEVPLMTGAYSEDSICTISFVPHFVSFFPILATRLSISPSTSLMCEVQHGSTHCNQ